MHEILSHGVSIPWKLSVSTLAQQQIAVKKSPFYLDIFCTSYELICKDNLEINVELQKSVKYIYIFKE